MAILNDDYKKKLGDLRHKEEEELATILSKKYGLQYVDLTGIPINTDALRLVSEKEAREKKLAPFKILGKKLSIAVLSPKNDATMAIVKGLEERNYQPILYMVSTKSLERAWERYKDITFAHETKEGVLDVSNEDIRNIVEKTRGLGEAKKVIQEVIGLKRGYRISRIVETIVAAGIATDASDIHIEPEESYIRLRLRLNGILTDVLNFDRETYELLLSRIKLLSGLKLNIKEKPQDGRFSIKISDAEIEIRSSTLPGAYGESVVMRILNPESISVPMEELGMDPDFLKVVEKEISRPNGMILNTGPTGSGKTTTLYAFLKKAHTPEVKIITIEDPIEYHLPGIVQTQVDVKNGYTFAGGLRSALRQDPDIIMVGEIRDKETAEIAINAALTGHLVFSTLHTNNAAGTFPRLIDLGVNSKLITSAINISMAQRLVRKLCQDCREEITPSPEQRKILDKVIPTLPKEKVLQTEKVWAPRGCDNCNKSGYRGRIGVFEAIISDESIEKVVEDNPSEREITKAAEGQKILSMLQDGIIKVLSGVTTFEELQRVLDFEEETI